MCKTSGIATRVLLAQLKCLDLGMVDAALNIQRTSKKTARGEKDEEIGSFTDEMAAIAQLEAVLSALNEKIESKAKENNVFRPTKVSHNIKTQLIKEFTRDFLVRFGLDKGLWSGLR